MRAEVPPDSLQSARVTPVIVGTAIPVSADRLVDSRTSNSYCMALVRIDESDLAAPNVRFYPGMPAAVNFRLSSAPP